MLVAGMFLLGRLSMHRCAYKSNMIEKATLARSISISHIPFIAPIQSPSRLPGWIPGPDDLTSCSKSYPRSTPVLTIATQIPILIHVPAPVTRSHASVFDPRRSSRFGRFLTFLPFLLAQTVEFHFSGKQRRWLCERGLLARCGCMSGLRRWSRCGDGW